MRRGGFQGWIVHAERGSSFASPNRLTVSSSGPALGHCVHARSASRKPGEITNVSAPRCRPAAWCPLELGARRRPLLWQQCGRQGQYGAVRGGEGGGKGALSSPAWPGPRMLAVIGQQSVLRRESACSVVGPDPGCRVVRDEALPQCLHRCRRRPVWR